jgi:hypothetical protein
VLRKPHPPALAGTNVAFSCAPQKGARVLDHINRIHSLTRFAESWAGWRFGRVGWGQGAWAKGGGRKTKAKNTVMI